MRSNSLYNLATIIFLVSLLISACGSAPTPTSTPEIPITALATATEPPPTTAPTATEVPPTATQPPEAAMNEPAGMYRVKLSNSSPLGIDAGYYRLTLNEDGSYKIDWAPTQAQDGMVGVNGTYTVEGNQIVFTDVEGFAACPIEEGVSGTYEWSLSSQGLTLTPIEDTCAGRVYVLSSKSLPRDR